MRVGLKKAKRTFMVPGWLKDDQCVNSFRAIYMPYWTYQVRATGHVSQTKVKSERDGDYVIETTRNFKSANLDRTVAVWSHDASKAFADDISEAIGFDGVDKNKMKPFHESYLSGIYADMAEDVAEKHKHAAMLEMKARLGKYASKGFNGKVILSEHKLSYLPVWFMSTRRGGKVTYAAINGYNGNIVADFPISRVKFFMLAGVAALVLAAFCFGVLRVT